MPSKKSTPELNDLTTRKNPKGGGTTAPGGTLPPTPVAPPTKIIYSE